MSRFRTKPRTETEPLSDQTSLERGFFVYTSPYGEGVFFTIYRTHIAFGVALCESILIVERVPLGWQSAAALGLAALAAPMPDIDKEGSWISQKLPMVNWFARRFQHRTMTHSLIVSALLYVLLFDVFALPPWLRFGLFIGYVSHWIIDLANPQGVHLFWPAPKRFWVRNPLTFMTIPVNSAGEVFTDSVLRIYCGFGLLFLLVLLIPNLMAGTPFSGAANHLTYFLSNWDHFGGVSQWLRSVKMFA